MALLKIPPTKGGVGGCPSGFQRRVQQRTSPGTPEGCEETELVAIQRVPPFPRGDYRGVLQALIQRWIPPSSPPLEKEGTIQDSKCWSLIDTFFHTFRGGADLC